MKLSLIIVLLSLNFTGFSQNVPQVELSNGLIHARCYLPDSATGYYRGTRFDWSGVVPELDYKGHSYFGVWFPRYEPTIHDAIVGPVEAFTPLGYSEAAVGGDFVQIGVGVLQRKDTTAWSPFRYYPIRSVGLWKVKETNREVSFSQTVSDAGYGYVYTKRIALGRGAPVLVITHTLRNTGSLPIVTDVYDHNFFVTDSQTIAPGISLKFPFALKPEQDRGLGDLAAVQGDSITVLRPFGARESVYAILRGYGGTSNDYDIRLENRITGAAVHIRADRPLSKLAFWGSVKTLCAEPFIHVSVPPGETFTWRIRYQFYTINPHS